MYKASSLILSLSLLSFLKCQEYHDNYNTVNRGEDGRDVAIHDTEGLANERDYIVNKGDARDYEVEDQRDNDREVDTRVAANYDHERDFRKANKCFHKQGCANGRGCFKGEGSERSEQDRFRVNENEKEITECSKNCGHRRRGNFHEECVEEKGKLRATNDKKCGERIKANKYLQRRKARRGFNEKDGEGCKEIFIRGCGQNFARGNIKKCVDDKRIGKRFHNEGSFINLHKRMREVEQDERANREHEVDVNRRDNNVVDYGVVGAGPREFEVKHGVEAKAVRDYGRNRRHYEDAGRDYEAERRD